MERKRNGIIGEIRFAHAHTRGHLFRMVDVAGDSTFAKHVPR